MGNVLTAMKFALQLLGLLLPLVQQIDEIFPFRKVGDKKADLVSQTVALALQNPGAMDNPEATKALVNQIVSNIVATSKAIQAPEARP